MTKNIYRLATITVGALEENCYLLADTESGETFIIDPGAEPDRIIEAIETGGLKPVGIINTHGHWDHIGANGALKQKYGIPIYAFAKEADYLLEPALNCSSLIGPGYRSPAADVLLADGQVLRLGQLEIKVLATPGHTAGGISLLVADLAFTGDTLFSGTMGRTDLPGGDEDVILASLSKFKELSPSLKILPGHGPSSTLEKELKHNPYLQR
jgi:glyoxylase-like metal-dependent hydrolase (beta-lactamase superfamily II)